MNLKLPKITARRVIVVLTLITLTQAGSSAYQRYLRCQMKADGFVATEAIYRQKGSVCEELALNLRQVAALARELAKSASTDFERSKWLEMARSEEEKASRLDHEAVQKRIHADRLASRANVYFRASWRPWLAEPE